MKDIIDIDLNITRTPRILSASLEKSMREWIGRGLSEPVNMLPNEYIEIDPDLVQGDHTFYVAFKHSNPQEYSIAVRGQENGRLAYFMRLGVWSGHHIDVRHSVSDPKLGSATPKEPDYGTGLQRAGLMREGDKLSLIFDGVVNNVNDKAQDVALDSLRVGMFTGQICELIIFDRPLTPQELIELDFYIMGKWG